MKNKSIVGGAVVAALGIALSFAAFAHANPSYFVPTVQTAAATSTASYMTPGTATTTLTYDTFNAGNNYKTNSATLLSQFAASTTPTFNINLQYSQDGIDWYADNLNVFAAGAIAVITPNSYTLAATASSTFKAININTPVRFVRVQYSIASGGNGAVWGQIVPNKEIAQ